MSTSSLLFKNIQLVLDSNLTSTLKSDEETKRSSTVNNIISNASSGAGTGTRLGSGPVCNPNYGGYKPANVVLNDTIRNVYIPARDKAKLTLSKGMILLMTAQTNQEGFAPGTVSFKTNNPGNIGTETQTKPKTIGKYKTLAEGIEAQQSFYFRIISGKSSYYKLSDTLYKFISTYAPKCYTNAQKQLVPGTNDPTAYTNLVINYFKKEGYTITAETTLAEINNIR
jgi:hypothetical protein